MEWLAQALQRQDARKQAYLAQQQQQALLQQQAASGEVALDDPRMAGVNPKLDQLFAEVAAQEAQQQQAPAVNPVAQSLVGNPRAPMTNLINNGMNAIGGALSGWTVPPGYEQAMAELGMAGQQPAQQAMQQPVEQQMPQAIGGLQFPPTPPVAQPAPVVQQQPQQAAPAAAPMQQSQQGSSEIINQLEMAARPMPEALPNEYQDTLAKVLGNEQQTQMGQSGTQTGTGKSVEEPTLVGMLSDPSLSRFLLGMGSALSQGVPFGAAVKAGVDERDRVLAAKADAPYQARKKEAELSKTTAETIKMVAEAGQAEALGGKARADAGATKVDTSLAGYKATTDRLKAEADQLSAKAAYKQAGAAIQEATNKMTDKGLVTDKDYASLMSGVVEAANSNVILGQELQAKGIDTLEFATGSINKGMKDPTNHRYLPLPSSKAAALQQEMQAIRAMPEGPETQKAVKAFEDRLIEYKMIYGRDALVPVFRQQQ